MESRNMVLMKLFSGQQWRNRHREQTYGQRGRGTVGSRKKERVRCVERVTQRLTLPYVK